MNVVPVRIATVDEMVSQHPIEKQRKKHRGLNSSVASHELTSNE